MSGEKSLNDRLKQWLADSGKDRPWLARELNVSEGTVKNWLSAGRKIVGPSKIAVSELISNETPPIRPKLSLAAYKAFESKVQGKGQTVGEAVGNLMACFID